MKTPGKRYVSQWALAIAFLIVCFPQIALAEPFETIVDNGSSTNRVDITILGDGYTAAEMQKYRNDVQALMTQFFNNDPFREYRNFFNVHRIDVISSQSGADHPERFPATFVNTALDATYNCNGTPRLICIDFSKANTIVGNSVAPAQHDIVFVIVNDPTYGGSRRGVAHRMACADLRRAAWKRAHASTRADPAHQTAGEEHLCDAVEPRLR